MLPIINRLKKENQFKRIYRRGKFIHGDFLDISYLKNNLNTRFGIVVTTKLISKATQRNRAKRILRGIIYQNKEFWPENIDLVIKIKNKIESEDKKNLAAEFVALIKKIDGEDKSNN